MTLETEIPEAPTKEEILEKPSNNDMWALVDALEDKIQAVEKTRKKFF